MEGLERGLVINININGKTLPTVDMPKVDAKEEPKAATMSEDEEKAASFDLELINKNRLDDAELVDLGQRISLWARELLKAKKTKVLQKFMDNSKHHLGNEVLSLIKDEIEAHKDGL